MKLLDRLEEWLISLLMGGATLIIFLSVLHRALASSRFGNVQDWALHLNFSWAQELCIIMFVWMCKFGAAYGVRTGIHVGVDVVVNRLEQPLRNRVVLFGLLAGALFTGAVGALGANFVWNNGAHYAFLKLLHIDPGAVFEGPTTPDLEWPTWIVYSAIPLGSSLMCLRFLQVAVAFWKTGELPRHDPTHVEGVDADAPLIGEAVVEAEGIERRQTPSSAPRKDEGAGP
jgi:C4-dicarboxylate transporter DctQ subunit